MFDLTNVLEWWIAGRKEGSNLDERRVAGEGGSLYALDRAHERQPEHRHRLTAWSIEREPCVAVKDPVRRALKLIHREHAHAFGHVANRRWNGIEEQVAIVEPDTELEGNRIAHRGRFARNHHLEGLARNLGPHRSRHTQCQNSE